MNTEIIVAAFSMLGTIIGSLAGILTANKLSNYRIQQLEKKVEKHNSVVMRTAVLEEQIKVANHRIDDLEKKERGYIA